MYEYIERRAANDAVTNAIWHGKWSMYDVASAINSVPNADVAPVRHGRWRTHSDRPDSLICSVCKCGFDMWKHDPHNYCPNCGAKMDGELNE